MARDRITRRRHRGVALALAMSLLAATGCGTRWTDEQESAVDAMLAGGGGDGTATGASGGSGPASSSTGAAATGGTAAGGSAATGAGAGGSTAAGAGGSADGGGEAAAASLPCSAPSDAPGVTDTEIVLGTSASLSGPVPGLGASGLAAQQAYVAYRNSIGGVCGRQVVLRSADDGGDNARGRAAVAEFAPQVLALIAGVAGGADGGVELIEAERIPVVGMSITPGIERSPMYFGLNAPLASYDAVIGKYRYIREQGVAKAAVVWIASSSAPQEAQRQMSLMRAAGIEVVLEQGLPLSTLSYDSTARAVANSGAQYLLFFHADSPSASMAQSMEDTGHVLQFEEYITGYGSNFVELAGPAAEGTSAWLYALPAEDGAIVAEQGNFLEWMAQTAPDASLDTFASRGWAGTKLLLDTIEALPGPISRDAILTQLQGTGVWDAGGMIDGVDVGARVSNGCLIGMIVEGGAWRRLVPSSGFLC